MRIRMLRNTIVQMPGETARVVDAGAVLPVDDVIGRMLIAAGKAALIDDAPPVTGAPHLHGIEHAVDAGAMTAERRGTPTNWGEALVSDLDGVGPVTARLLAEAGIETMADLLATDAPTLAHLARVSSAKAEKWRQRAATIVAGEP